MTVKYISGVSVDGPKQLNDLFRVDHLGRGTYDRVMANVASMLDAGNGGLIGGFLSVANPTIPPNQYLDWIQALPITKVDVLWPIQYNWNNPPWGLFPRKQYAINPKYGSWFGQLFSLWWDADDPAIIVRTFNNLVSLAIGGRGHVDMLVNDSMNMFVVNTDGAYEYPDYLRNAGDGTTRTGHTVFADSLVDLAATEGFMKLLQLSQQLPEVCKPCGHRDICGGGFLPGRADPKLVISQRESVLCDDQKYFFNVAMEQIRYRIAQRDARG